MLSTVWFCIIMLIFVDLFFISWIYTLNKSIKKIQSKESPLCPLYFCDFYTDPSTGSLQPGSYCYNNLNSDITKNTGQMLAYRYTNSDKTTYSCQNTLLESNIVD